jgi:hypothetical protein
MGLEGRALRFVPVKALYGLADGADGHLGRQAEANTNFTVRQFMDRRLAEDARIESALGCERCSFVVAPHGFQQPCSLRGVGKQLQLERQFHYLGLYNSLERNASGKGVGGKAAVLSLRRLKATVSRTIL